MTEYEHAVLARLDLALRHAQHVSDVLTAVRAHTRSIVAAIVAVIVISFLLALVTISTVLR